MALFACYSYTTLSAVLQTAPSRFCTILPKVDSIFNPQDIFLWPDGYWCYREEFYRQPRQAYTYRLVRMESAEWHSMRDYPLMSPSRPQQHAAQGGARI